MSGRLLSASLPLLIQQDAGGGALKPVFCKVSAVLLQEAGAELEEQLAQEQEGPWGEQGVCLLPRSPLSAHSRGEWQMGELPWGR